MEAIHFTRYLSLALLVAAWCVLHSALVSIPVKDYSERRLGYGYRFYRLLFNLISIVTLVPVVVFSQSVRSQELFHWDGYPRFGQVVLIAAASLLFILGGRYYDAREFLGIKQIQEGLPRRTTNGSRELQTSGVLAITRHPWYLATIFLIWARTLDVSAILVNLILTAYLILGTVFEERKLIREFGGVYSEYQRRVSMLFPTKWLTSNVREAFKDIR